MSIQAWMRSRGAGVQPVPASAAEAAIHASARRRVIAPGMVRWNCRGCSARGMASAVAGGAVGAALLFLELKQPREILRLLRTHRGRRHAEHVLRVVQVRRRIAMAG